VVEQREELCRISSASSHSVLLVISTFGGSKAFVPCKITGHSPPACVTDTNGRNYQNTINWRSSASLLLISTNEPGPSSIRCVCVLTELDVYGPLKRKRYADALQHHSISKLNE
jgi:hypothetical protein